MHSEPRQPLRPSQLWTEQAKCRQVVDPDRFYPDRDAVTYAPTAAQAKAICRGTDGRPACPVLLECLAYALFTGENFGIWGGLSTRERNALRRIGDLRRYRVVELLPPNPYSQTIQNYLTDQLEHRSDDHQGPGTDEPAGLPAQDSTGIHPV